MIQNNKSAYKHLAKFFVTMGSPWQQWIKRCHKLWDILHMAHGLKQYPADQLSSTQSLGDL